MKFIEKLLSKNLYNDKKTAAVSIGALGEEAAVKALKKQGYRIIDRNYRTRFGEIDVIARDGEYICFVEVRLRKNNDYGSPAESIDKRKRNRIITTAKIYAASENIYDAPMRFDVVLINAEASAGKLKNPGIEIIRNAFY